MQANALVCIKYGFFRTQVIIYMTNDGCWLTCRAVAGLCYLACQKFQGGVHLRVVLASEEVILADFRVVELAGVHKRIIERPAGFARLAEGRLT